MIVHYPQGFLCLLNSESRRYIFFFFAQKPHWRGHQKMLSASLSMPAEKKTWCYYLHQSKYLVSPEYGIFLHISKYLAKHKDWVVRDSNAFFLSLSLIS